MPHNHIGGLQCEECGDHEGPMYIHSRCHTSAPTMCSVEGDLLKIECAECEKPIAYFLLASGPYRTPPLPADPDPAISS